ncbi:hypothetical protein RND71_019683 [Anisodus tanguticus]|uniref:Uncharacterized protein n=1 Tax=Anisodus tanguticus TaxID=243964 RepID=A0AAE1VEK0_9SOLA|nr:hypothetical protein RND71_019683 [Anisodus tanguticus]
MKLVKLKIICLVRCQRHRKKPNVIKEQDKTDSTGNNIWSGLSLKLKMSWSSYERFGLVCCSRIAGRVLLLSYDFWHRRWALRCWHGYIGTGTGTRVLALGHLARAALAYEDSGNLNIFDDKGIVAVVGNYGIEPLNENIDLKKKYKRSKSQKEASSQHAPSSTSPEIPENVERDVFQASFTDFSDSDKKRATHMEASRQISTACILINFS